MRGGMCSVRTIHCIRLFAVYHKTWTLSGGRGGSESVEFESLVRRVSSYGIALHFISFGE